MNGIKIACPARPANAPLFKALCQWFSLSADFTMPDTVKAVMCFDAEGETQLSFEPLVPEGFDAMTYERFGTRFVEWINDNVIGPEMPTAYPQAWSDKGFDAFCNAKGDAPECPNIPAPPSYFDYNARIDDLERTIDALGHNVDANHDKAMKRIDRQNKHRKRLLNDINDVLSNRSNDVTANGKHIQSLRIDAFNAIEDGRKRDKAIELLLIAVGNITDRLEALEVEDSFTTSDRITALTAKIAEHEERERVMRGEIERLKESISVLPLSNASKYVVLMRHEGSFFNFKGHKGTTCDILKARFYDNLNDAKEASRVLIESVGVAPVIEFVRKTTEDSFKYSFQHSPMEYLTTQDIKDSMNLTEPDFLEVNEFLVYETATAADTQKALLHGDIIATWVARYTNRDTSLEKDMLEEGDVMKVSSSDANALILRAWHGAI